MRYPIVIHKDRGTDFGVTVPDLPGCHSAGATVDEAIAAARQAIDGHLAALRETKQKVPEPRPLEVHKADPEFAEAYTWATVEVQPPDSPQSS